MTQPQLPHAVAPIFGLQPTRHCVREESPPWPTGAGNRACLVLEEIGRDETAPALSLRYEPLADHLAAVFGQPHIGVRSATTARQFEELTQRGAADTLVFGKSVHRLAHLVRDQGWRPLVRRAGAFKAAFIVPGASPLVHLSQAQGARIVLPDEASPFAAVARAELQRRQLAGTRITHVRHASSIEAFLRAGVADVGVVDIRTARRWAALGGGVLAETLPMVHWSVLAAPGMDPALAAAARDSLLRMNTEAPATLACIGVRRWLEAGRTEYLDLLDYLRE